MPAEALAAYLAGKWREPVAITGFKRFHGGASRQTFRFDATGANSGRREALVLRRDPVSSLIETDRAAEYAALKAFAGSVVPVPEPLWLETTAAGFGGPGFLMREIAGGAAAGLLTPEPYGDHAKALGEALFTALGWPHSCKSTKISPTRTARKQARRSYGRLWVRQRQQLTAQ